MLPTHSAYAQTLPDELAARVPKNFPLLQHQVAAYEAITTRRADVIIHTGLTGDGKSLAGELPLLLNKQHRTLAMYPTNELITDQKRHLDQEMRRWNAKRQVRELNALTLDQQGAAQDVDRANALLSFLNNTDVILTNPDIFHYIVSGRYVTKDQQPFRILQPLITQYPQITIDEFHLFDQAQTTALLTALIFIKVVNGAHAPLFVLQSATPDDEIQKALDRAGLTVHMIEGTYQNQEGPAPTGYRTILQGVDLEIVSDDDIGAWLKEHTASVLLPLLQQGGQRIAALFNSVFGALNAYAQVASALPGYNVRHNTGLSPRSMREASRYADVLLGTSTVDLGVDLHINHLIFEAYDAASFKQRLGRLARHEGYTTAGGTTIKFNRFTAVACVPPWVKAKLEETAQANMRRDDFFKLVEDAYGSRRGHIFAYNRTWGWLPAYDLTYRMGNPVIRDAYKDVKQPTAQALSNALRVGLSKKREQYDTLKIGADNRHIRDEAFAFRDSNPLTALIINPAYQGAERYQFYDLLSLVTRIDFKPLDLHLTRLQAERDGVPAITFTREKPVIALEWLAAAQERRRLHLSLAREAWQRAEPLVAQGVFVTDGLRLVIAPAVDLGAAPNLIEQKSIVLRLCLNYPPSTLYQRLRLSTFFPLHRFESYDGTQQGSVALGRNALLLDAALQHLRETEPGALII